MDYRLVEKYNVAVPRYTSYPAVPLWDSTDLNPERWMNQVVEAFEKDREISLYIHLPYCESLCTYCGCNKHITKNHLVEQPYVQAVLKEWRMYTSRFPEKAILREIHLGGGTPTFFSPENLRVLIEGILAEAEVADFHSFSFEAHPFSTSDEHLETLFNLGFNRLSLGIQDFDPKILSLINRFQTAEQVEHIVSKAREIGYESINFDLIYGLPQQTEGNIRTNLKWVESLKPDRIAFYSYAHVPGVAPSQRAYDESDLPLGEAKWNLYRLGADGFLKMGYQEIGMDHFALPQDDLAKSARAHKLHRNFMGYTPHHTHLALALGASSISDVWSAFAQNEKKLKDYLHRVNTEDYPPLIKTHYHSDEDLKTRAKLLNLICHFEGEWLDERDYFDDFLKSRFRLLEEDGLLKVFPYQVKVTRKGRAFIRNVCSVLDRKLSAGELQKPTFSKAV
ncbi:oxygen-independent coproporphyrinogen III oxidase [Croceimicrobium hydrocarbonivorans]|uniref:Coproporphyrinogen-III oxidase n=1 Tax=Croceimicrobium hydrocarbonivorans TaxID=2761580 RepID=A0A7H0VIL1_9FLAO|nr:oxygen-independent coproporphyrinogen III oxidase [Croceimicrobium hydrocarbonivorans]QNR25559.1 oxygen-independent coproporphyrinogen III oxidase [Croceimicrobium hydrocarbonivorans]